MDILSMAVAKALAKEYTDSQLQDLGIESMSYYFCSSGEYNASTGVPNVTSPNSTTFYIAPAVGSGNGAFNVYIYKNNAWVLFKSLTLDMTNMPIDDSLTMNNYAADAATVGGELTAIKADISEEKTAFDDYQMGELPIRLIKNSYVRIDGTINSYVGWDRTDYIPVKGYSTITASSSERSDYNVFFDASKNKVGESFSVGTTDTIISVPENAVYAIMSNTASGMANLKTSFSTAHDTQISNEMHFINANFEQMVYSHFNLIDLSTFEDGYLWTYRKNKTPNSSTSIASPIPIKSGVTYYLKNVRNVYSFFQYNDGTYLKLTETDVTNVTITATKDGYAYLTVNASGKNMAVMTEDETLFNSPINSSYYTPKNLELGIEANHVFRVGPGREYTSLLEGIIAAEQYKNSTVYVDPGTYDMVQEFKTKYGANFFTNENYLTQENHRGCPLINGVHIIGYGGVTVTGGLETTDSEDAIGDWSIFSAGDDANGDNGYGFTLENLTIKSVSQHIRYLVHDEYGNTNYDYINKYINIHFIVFPGYVKRCIGGGLGKHGYILIDNCTIDAPAYDATIRGINYHNDANTGALNEIYIKNCYIPNGTVGITWYGRTPETEKSMLYVNNCYLQAEPVKRAETASAPFENVDIVSWCNTIVP